jgi:hypothetical protein
MDCPNCGTWNPDDKIRCWRCNVELPKPESPKKKKAALNAAWLWVIVIAILLCTLAQCFVIQQGNASGATSSLSPVISTQPVPF